jgi:dihydroflavonol-4-reductase
MKVAITGANGLIGANLARALLDDGYRVVALARPTSALATLAGLPIELKRCDVLEPHGLAEAFAGCSVVFHAAAHFAYHGHSPAALERTAVLGTRNVLDAARRAGVGRVVLTSSSVVLGARTTRTVLDETATFDDTADEPPYVQVKVKQERAAFAYAELGIELVAVCPTMSIGPHAPSLGPSNAIVVTYLGDPFRMTYPGGCNIVSVADVARGHILAATAGVPGERYVLGGENLEWAQIHTMIAELAGVPAPLVYGKHTACYLAALSEEILARLGRRAPVTTREQAKMVGRYYWYSHAKAARLGYSPRPARRALAAAIAWLAASPHISREVRAGMLLSREVYEERRKLARVGSIETHEALQKPCHRQASS